MNINLSRTFKDMNITFTGQRLCSVKFTRVLCNGGTESLYGSCSLMDKSDLKLIKSTKKQWSATQYGDYILKRFIDHRRGSDVCKYFMVECPSLDNKRRIRALAEVIDDGKSLLVSYLQSASKLKENDEIKGGGTMLLYALAKSLSAFKRSCIMLVPSSVESCQFYKKLGFVNFDREKMILTARRAKNFIKKTEDKYGIEPTRVISLTS